MAKTHAFGTTFTWDSEIVAALKSIGGIQISVDTVDVTTHDSTDAYKEYIAGLLDAGEVALEGFFDYADADGQVAMVADCAARAVKSAVITFPASTGTTWAFNGLITAIKIGDAPTDDGIPFSATVKVTGKPTFAVATSAGLTGAYFTVSGAGTVIAPTAAGNVYEYIVNVANGIDSVKITPTAATGTITVDGATVVSAAESGSIELTAGAIRDVKIIVKETDKAPKTYLLHILRAAAA